MIAALVLAAAAAPVIIADPRCGPSPWGMAVAGAPMREDATTVLVALPARGEDIDQRWLEGVVALAAGGRRVVALGTFVPPAAVLPYLDGVALDPAPPDGELAALAGAMAGVPLFVTAGDAAGAVRVLAAGASGALVPAPSPLWDAEMVALLPESVAARGPGGELATALRGRDLALVVGIGRDFAGGDVFLPMSPVARVEWVGERRETLAVRRVRDGVVVSVPAGGAVIVARRAAAAGDVVAALDVAGESLPTAAEVLARHQRQAARQAVLVPHWQGEQRLLVRVTIAELARSFEVVMQGPAFYEDGTGTDWEIREAFLDGVRWDLDRFPAMPLLEPRRPPVPPLALRLDAAWAYELRGVVSRNGRRCFELSFSNGDGPAAGRRRGTAFIDAETFALIERIEVGENLPGDVRSSRTTATYRVIAGFVAPVALPLRVVADDLLPAFGGASTVHRELDLSAIDARPGQFEIDRAAAWAREHRMLRDTQAGIVPLEPDGQGGRRVGDGRRRPQRFLLGGAVWDAGLPFPIPYGGFQLWDFDWRGRGDQLRVLIAGVVNDGALAVRRGPFELSARAFVQAVPFAGKPAVDGDEIDREELKVRTQRLGAAIAITPGRTRWQLDLGANYWDFGSTDLTGVGFVVPSDTWEWTGRIDGQVPWGAAVLAATGETGVRQRWSVWGDDAPPRRTWRRARLSWVWEKEIAPFTRLHLDSELFVGTNLDRFSAPSPGRFGALRVRGVASGRVQADAFGAVRASFAWPFSDRLRFEAGADAAWVRDPRSGSKTEPLVGIGASFTVPGPWATLVQGGIGFPLATPGRRAPAVELFILRPLR